jgi:autotransporter strand-loop-strand O-heptosyltransferase
VSGIDTSSAQRGRTESSFAKPGVPRFSGPEGILYDFNYGCRVQVPVDGWRVRVIDLDSHTLAFDEPVEANTVVTSRRKYFLRWGIEVLDGERPVFAYAYDARDKPIVVRLASSALGDSLAWVPIVEAFRERHQCELFLVTPLHLQALYRASYPDLHFVTEDDIRDNTFYATYFLALFSPYEDRDHQPTYPRVSSMQGAISYMLGLPCVEHRPNLVVADTQRRIKEATSASRLKPRRKASTGTTGSAGRR